MGAEVTVKALADAELRGLAEWVVIGDRAAVTAAEDSTGLRLAVELADQGLVTEPVEAGALRADYGAAAAAYVKTATEMCLDGAADAMVTAPLNKEAVTMSGMKFSGHTEYIADLCALQAS